MNKIALVILFSPFALFAQSAPSSDCGMQAALERLAVAVEHNNDMQRASLMLQRVQVGLTIGSRAETELREAAARKQTLAEENQFFTNEIAAIDEKLRSAANQSEIS